MADRASRAEGQRGGQGQERDSAETSATWLNGDVPSGNCEAEFCAYLAQPAAASWSQP
jgi:hypothetical protein